MTLCPHCKENFTGIRCNCGAYIADPDDPNKTLKQILEGKQNDI